MYFSTDYLFSRLNINNNSINNIESNNHYVVDDKIKIMIKNNINNNNCNNNINNDNNNIKCNGNSNNENNDIMMIRMKVMMLSYFALWSN